MITKKITYENFDGEEVTEELYFRLSTKEMSDDEFQKIRDRIADGYKKKDSLQVLNAILEIIIKSYGKKSEDGKSFIKTEEATKNFENSEACDELAYELMNNEGELQKFIEGIMPKKLYEQYSKIPEKDLKEMVEKELKS